MENNYRHEYKFLISSEAAQLLKLRLPHVMRRDPHAGAAKSYTIRSLYFDDPSYQAFHDKLTGVDDRVKYRIRCYNYDETHFRLEKKEKKGHLTRKTGQTIDRETVLQLQKDPINCRADGLANELRLQCVCAALRPAVIVDYDRTPFVCHAGNTRITLDENLRTVPHCKDIFGQAHAMVPILEPGESILEVKFDDFLPGYLSDVLSDLPKAPMAISKFAMCLNLI